MYGETEGELSTLSSQIRSASRPVIEKTGLEKCEITGIFHTTTGMD
jgi:hypothetical protein